MPPPPPPPAGAARVGSRARDLRMSDERSGDPVVDFEPLEVAGEQLETLFDTSKKRKFITYVDPTTFAEQGVTGVRTDADSRIMVRVNIKFDPYDTKIKHPRSWDNWRKSTLGRNKESHKWEQIEDRVPIDSSKPAEDYDRICVFAQPPRITQGGVAYL